MTTRRHNEDKLPRRVGRHEHQRRLTVADVNGPDDVCTLLSFDVRRACRLWRTGMRDVATRRIIATGLYWLAKAQKARGGRYVPPGFHKLPLVVVGPDSAVLPMSDVRDVLGWLRGRAVA